jgi:hypothetical protein
MPQLGRSNDIYWHTSYISTFARYCSNTYPMCIYTPNVDRSLAGYNSFCIMIRMRDPFVGTDPSTTMWLIRICSWYCGTLSRAQYYTKGICRARPQTLRPGYWYGLKGSAHTRQWMADRDGNLFGRDFSDKL